MLQAVTIRIVACCIVGLALIDIFFSQASNMLPPHIVCWRSSLGLIWLHAAGDIAVWLAYMAIPAGWLYLARIGRTGRSRYMFPSIQGWGAAFVLTCGIGHLLDFLEIWYSVQWARGWWKAGTGIVSWIFLSLVIRHRQEIAAVARAIVRAELAEGE